MRALPATVTVLLLAGLGIGLWGVANPAAGPASARRPPVAVAPGPPTPSRSPGTVSRMPPRVEGSRPAKGQTRAATPTGPRVAIIFDDAGASLDQVAPILALGRPVTLAVLPGLRASQAVADAARAQGLEVLLHLPLEADDPERRLGPGGVTTAMDDDQIRATVRENLAGVPGAVGLSGHMGSRGTADPRVMRVVLEVVREGGLFFVDSRTTAASVAADLAREMGVRTAARSVFLDNEDDPEYVAAQVRQLLEMAKTRGEAIGIGHVQRVTAQVLRRLLPEFDRAGVVFVPVSALVR